MAGQDGSGLFISPPVLQAEISAGLSYAQPVLLSRPDVVQQVAFPAGIGATARFPAFGSVGEFRESTGKSIPEDILGAYLALVQCKQYDKDVRFTELDLRRDPTGRITQFIQQLGAKWPLAKEQAIIDILQASDAADATKMDGRTFFSATHTWIPTGAPDVGHAATYVTNLSNIQSGETLSGTVANIQTALDNADHLRFGWKDDKGTPIAAGNQAKRTVYVSTTAPAELKKLLKLALVAYNKAGLPSPGDDTNRYWLGEADLVMVPRMASTTAFYVHYADPGETANLIVAEEIPLTTVTWMENDNMAAPAQRTRAYGSFAAQALGWHQWVKVTT